MPSCKIGIVVPTKDSALTLRACLASIKTQTLSTPVVVVDNYSRDETRAIARDFTELVLCQGPERSAQRNAGAQMLDAGVLGFVDSDMVLEPNVVAEALDLIAAGAVAVIVPEESTGRRFWAKVRRLERSFYAGLDSVEAARFFDARAFRQLGGFDEALDAGEDWDLTLRVRQLGRVERTKARIYHDEGQLSYLRACSKKAQYADGLWRFQRKHGPSALRHAFARPYLRRPWKLLWPHPILGAGVLSLKAGEAVAVGWYLLRRRRGSLGESAFSSPREVPSAARCGARPAADTQGAEFSTSPTQGPVDDP